MKCECANFLSFVNFFKMTNAEILVIFAVVKEM